MVTAAEENPGVIRPIAKEFFVSTNYFYGVLISYALGLDTIADLGSNKHKKHSVTALYLNPRYQEELLQWIIKRNDKNIAPNVEEIQNKAYTFRVEQIKFANAFADLIKSQKIKNEVNIEVIKLEVDWMYKFEKNTN